MNENPDSQGLPEMSDRRSTNQAFSLGAQIGTLNEQTRQHSLRIDRVEHRVDEIDLHLTKQDHSVELHFNKSDESIQALVTSIQSLNSTFQQQHELDQPMREFFIEDSKRRIQEAQRMEQLAIVKAKTSLRRSNIWFTIGNTLTASVVVIALNSALQLNSVHAAILIGIVALIAVTIQITVFIRSKHDSNVDTKMGIG